MQASNTTTSCPHPATSNGVRNCPRAGSSPGSLHCLTHRPRPSTGHVTVLSVDSTTLASVQYAPGRLYFYSPSSHSAGAHTHSPGSSRTSSWRVRYVTSTSTSRRPSSSRRAGRFTSGGVECHELDQLIKFQKVLGNLLQFVLHVSLVATYLLTAVVLSSAWPFASWSSQRRGVTISHFHMTSIAAIGHEQEAHPIHGGVAGPARVNPGC